MGLTEEAFSTPNTHATELPDAGRPWDVELAGEGQPRGVIATTAGTTPSSGRPWPLILAVVTFAADITAIALSYFLAKVLAHGVGWDSGKPINVNPLVFLTVAIWPAVFAAYGLYDLRRPTHATAEFHRLINALLTSLMLVVLTTFLARIDVSRSLIVSLLGFALVTTISGRLLIRRLSHALNARAVTSQATLIAGTNEEARALARTLRRQPGIGYSVRGFVEVAKSGLESIDGLPVLGAIDDLARITTEAGARAVIVAGSAAGGATLQLIDSALSADVAVRVSPGLANLGAARVILEPIDGMALFSLRRHRFSRRQRVVKRCLDLAVASVTLAIAAPLMATIALIVRLTSQGPVLFRQSRVGVQDRRFTMLKFRTMIVGAHAERQHLHARNEADGLLFKMRFDPRVTRVGKWLRRTSLDELPQLFNVLRGDMSLVGPRPALPEETARYGDAQRARLRVKPGVTGLWQVNGRHDLAYEDYVRYDLFYVENWSLTMDLYILARTVPALLTGRGSY